MFFIIKRDVGVLSFGDRDECEIQLRTFAERYNGAKIVSRSDYFKLLKRIPKEVAPLRQTLS